MKKKINKKLNEIENKIVKLLDKKVSVCSVMWLIIFLILFSLLFYRKPSYSYIDMNNNAGHSSNCYHTSDKLMCDVSVEVRQFYKN